MKNDQIKKLSSRQWQRIKVLTSKPDFTNAISKLRGKWDVPVSGLKNQQELDSWYQQLEQNTKNYFSQKWPKERETLLKIKAQGDHSKYSEQLKKFNDSVPRNAFLRDIKKMVKALKLSPRWVQGVKRYLLTDDPDTMGMFIGPVLRTQIDLEFQTEVIYLKIEANTTLEDIKAVWPNVKEMQSRLPYKEQKKFQPLRQFSRNKKAFELRQQDMKYREIAKELSTKKKTYGYEEVGKMIERYKKKVDIS